MRRKQVRFVGNCQSNALANFYRDFVGGPAGEEVVSVDDLGLDSAGIRRAVEGADLVLLQERDFKHVLTREELGGSIAIHSFPLIMAGFLWPFANEPHVRNVAERPISDGPYPSQMGDSFLNRLIQKEVSAEEALAHYAALDIGRIASLDRMFEIYMDRQRQRDDATGYQLADFIAANFRTQRLFLTAEHPDAALFGLAARQLFERLDVPADVTEGALATLHRTPFPPTELPLHPGVIAHFGLEFADADTRYRYVDEGRFTFADYVLRYMRYDNNPLLRTAIFMAERQPPAEALAQIEQALELSPQSVRGFQIKGGLLRRLGRVDEAITAYRTAAANDPADPEPRVDLVRTLIAAGEIDAAATQAQAAIDIAPDFAFAHLALAEARIADGRLDEAFAKAAPALRRGPVNAAPLRQLSMALAAAGWLTEAESFARRAFSEDIRADYANLLAEILEQLGRRAEAIVLLETQIAQALENDQSYSLLGNFRLRDGALAEAEAAFARGAELHGDRRPDLGECLVQVQQMRAAAA